MDRLPILLDAGSSGRGWSWREPFQRCMQKGAFANAATVMVDASPALAKGSLVHVGLAHWAARRQATENGWKGGPEGPSADSYHPPEEAIRLVAEKNGWVRYTAQATETVSSYLADRPWAQNRILAVEQRMVRWVSLSEGGGFVPAPPDAEARIAMAKNPAGRLLLATMGEPYLDTCRADLIVGDAGGRVYVVDYKTATAYKAESKLMGYTLSGQFLGLQAYGRHLWKDRFGGVLIAMVPFDPPRSGPRWPVLNPEPAPWAVRNYVSMICESEVRIGSYVAAVAATAFGGDAAKAADWLSSPEGEYRWPMALSEQVCVGRYGVCPFVDRCCWGPPEGWGVAPGLTVE